MLRAVHRGPHQVVEAGVDQHEVVLARTLGGAYLGQQHPRGADQEAVLAALRFKCDVLWSQLDALHFAYVEPGLIPPGAFVPEGR